MNNKLIKRYDKSGASSLVDVRSWVPLRFSDAEDYRVVTRGGSSTPIFSAYSTSGNQNSCTFKGVQASLSSGTGTTNTSCSTFSYPLLKSNGKPLQLDEPWTINFYIKVTQVTTSATDNDIIVACGIFDGDLDLQGGRIATGLHYNNNTGPRIFSAGNGLSITAQQSNGNANFEQAWAVYDCEPLNGSRNFTYSMGIGLDNNGEYEATKRWTSLNAFANSKVSGDAYVALHLGRSGNNVTTPDITFEAYYCLTEPPVYQGSITGAPTIEGR